MGYMESFHCSFLSAGGMDHVRVHPKFLHSNATVHKWVLGGKAAIPVYNTFEFICASLLINVFSDPNALILFFYSFCRAFGQLIG